MVEIAKFVTSPAPDAINKQQEIKLKKWRQRKSSESQRDHPKSLKTILSYETFIEIQFHSGPSHKQIRIPHPYKFCLMWYSSCPCTKSFPFCRYSVGVAST